MRSEIRTLLFKQRVNPTYFFYEIVCCTCLFFFFFQNRVHPWDFITNETTQFHIILAKFRDLNYIKRYLKKRQVLLAITADSIISIHLLTSFLTTRFQWPFPPLLLDLTPAPGPWNPDLGRPPVWHAASWHSVEGLLLQLQASFSLPSPAQ